MLNVFDEAHSINSLTRNSTICTKAITIPGIFHIESECEEIIKRIERKKLREIKTTLKIIFEAINEKFRLFSHIYKMQYKAKLLFENPKTAT